MAIVVPDEGLINLLNLFYFAYFRIKLYKVDHYPTATSVLADFTFADDNDLHWGATASSMGEFSNPTIPVMSGDHAITYSDVCQWQRNAYDSTIYGWVMFDNNSGYIYDAERIATPVTIDASNPFFTMTFSKSLAQL